MAACRAERRRQQAGQRRVEARFSDRRDAERRRRRRRRLAGCRRSGLDARRARLCAPAQPAHAPTPRLERLASPDPESGRDADRQAGQVLEREHGEVGAACSVTAATAAADARVKGVSRSPAADAKHERT